MHPTNAMLEYFLYYCSMDLNCLNFMNIIRQEGDLNIECEYCWCGITKFSVTVIHSIHQIQTFDVFGQFDGKCYEICSIQLVPNCFWLNVYYAVVQRKLLINIYVTDTVSFMNIKYIPKIGCEKVKPKNVLNKTISISQFHVESDFLCIRLPFKLSIELVIIQAKLSMNQSNEMITFFSFVCREYKENCLFPDLNIHFQLR